MERAKLDGEVSALPFILRYAEKAPVCEQFLPGDPLLGRDSTTVYATDSNREDTTSDDN